MKINRLSFIVSFFMTFAISGIVTVFYFIQYMNTKIINWYLFFGVSIIFIINYIGVDYIFRYYIRKQIKKLTNNLPEKLFENSEKIGFKEISERMNQNISEIDMIKKMETYRKEYIGNVSHELKTPLFAIQGYIEILQDGGIENLNIRDKYLERIAKSVDRLNNIVADLDTLTRFEVGEIQLKITQFDINLLVKEIFELLDFDAQTKDAVLKLETCSNQILVSADKHRITQVLTNLISNAIHYSNRQQAQIVVKTRTLLNKVHIEVEDNGMGIKPEVLPRIFERFYRVESSRNRRQGGSGLGLAIVKHILDAHNETITVESEYLEGTKFSFMLEKAYISARNL